MAGVVVRPRARVLTGHDWVYGTEILKTFGSPADGDVVSIKDGRDKLLGVGIYNSQSQITVRRFSRRRQDLDRDFFERRVQQAIEVRDRRGCRADLRRLVWSESDGLPGVIADRYGQTIVLQTLTRAMDARKAEIAEVLMALTGARGVIERNDAPVRALEGMESIADILIGDPEVEQTLDIGGVRYAVDLLAGQKTGFYLDQVGNYAAIAAHARGKRVLDCFANQGGFALACAQAGASEVVAVESGEESFRLLEANAASNGLSVRAERADVFHFLRKADSARERYDVVILDPPSFTKGRGKVNDAMRGYRDLHRQASLLLDPGGILATFSCSHHVTGDAFLDSARAGLLDARRSARVVAAFDQAPDHPVVLHLPETAYLKGYLLEMMPGR